MNEVPVPVVETVKLKKYYKTRGGYLHAVDGINLKIMRGETLGVVGESGCGKSTLGRTVIGLHEPTSGKVLFKGRELSKMKKHDPDRKRMSMIFQDPYSSLNPRMCVADLIADPMQVNHLYGDKHARYKRVEELMDIVGLSKRVANSYPHELDGGRRQRIGIARALAVEPEFIVCDEPVSALDVSIQAQILNLLMDLQEQLGLTYMFVTHDLSVVKHISTNIMVTYLGKCVEYGPTDRIFENPCHPYTRALLSALPEPTLAARGRKIELLTGEIVTSINPKPGCRFAPRCSQCAAACTESDPEEIEVEPGHFVSCKLCAAG